MTTTFKTHKEYQEYLIESAKVQELKPHVYDVVKRIIEDNETVKNIYSDIKKFVDHIKKIMVNETVTVQITKSLSKYTEETGYDTDNILEVALEHINKEVIYKTW